MWRSTPRNSVFLRVHDHLREPRQRCSCQEKRDAWHTLHVDEGGPKSLHPASSRRTLLHMALGLPRTGRGIETNEPVRWFVLG